MEKIQFSRYEMSRILGARALQIAMNAPILVKIDKAELEKIHFDPLKIAEIEFSSGILPIEVNKPLPLRREDKLRRTKDSMSDKKVEEGEENVEGEIEKEGEMMELANPDDEQEESESGSDSREE